MTKPIDDTELKYAIRLDRLLKEMRHNLTDDQFTRTVKYTFEKNGFRIGASQITPKKQVKP